jgi:hypothetical protein
MMRPFLVVPNACNGCPVIGCRSVGWTSLPASSTTAAVGDKTSMFMRSFPLSGVVGDAHGGHEKTGTSRVPVA